MKRQKSVSLEAIRTVLTAIATIEGWDSEHPSVATYQDTEEWIRVDGKLMPSVELISAIARIQGRK